MAKFFGLFPVKTNVGPSGEMLAAGQLAPVEQPKVKRGPITLPSFLRSAKPGDGVLARTDRRLANTNIQDYRNGTSTRAVLRDFIAASPDLSAAKSAYTRLAITDSYVAVAKNLDGTFNREATALLQQLLVRFDVLGDYKDGFCGIGSMRSNSESLIGDCLINGAMSLELVLDKARLPRKLQPIATAQIEFTTDGEGLVPQQNLAGEIRVLDIPTFFYCALDQDLLEPYAASPFEAAIQPVQFQQEFMDDLRKIVKRSIHPRLDLTVVWDRFKEALPSDAMHDGEKMRAYMTAFIGDLQTAVNDLKPEDALVHFDSTEVSYLNNGNTTTNEEYKVLEGIVNRKMAAGAKVLPSILGHGNGTQDTASAETLLFMKSAMGIQGKVNELYSRSLTLAVRLFGHDVYVEFRYKAIDLRPESELEAYAVMRQERILRQLSLGFIQDDDAAIQLTGQLTPPGFVALSGTHFMDPPAAGGDSGNPDSTTGAKPGEGRSTNRKLAPDTPRKAKGPA